MNRYRTCRGCGTQIRWRGFGRPPVMCEACRPANYPKRGHKVSARVSDDVRARDRKRRAARAAATRQLIAAHRDEYEAFLADELAGRVA